MNLVADLGNSRIKLAVIDDNDVILALESHPNNASIHAINDLKQKYIFQRVILSATGAVDDSLLSTLNDIDDLVFLSENISIPIQIEYATPSTLGKDRLAAAVGAFIRFPDRNALIIDMGTCITMDLVTDKGIFKGGNISPGIQMRLKAMHQFTARLPLVSAMNTNSLFGYSTESAIQNGAVRGALYEIEYLITQAKAQFSEINVILTGGDAHFFESWTKNEIFAAPNLVIEGLNEILKYNAKKNL